MHFNSQYMSQNTAILNSEQMELYLCKQLESVRLLKNISQANLAEAAGVSRRTISRMENGKGISLDTFIRVMTALDLADHLKALVPSSEIRPIERVKRKRERKNASSPRIKKDAGKEQDAGKDTKWEWGN